MTNLIEYCHAAVNLYGVIHITELADLIEKRAGAMAEIAFPESRRISSEYGIFFA